MRELKDSATPPAPLLPWRRVLFWTAGVGIFVGAFFVPQEIPLEWYPLNEPGTEILYLEIKCASDKDGWVGVFYDTGKQFNDYDSIRFPISPTEQTYTYTFPLRDASILAMRVDPPAKGGTLRVHHMRIINRREEEVRRFDVDSLVPVQQIAAIQRWDEAGWSITSTPEANDAYAYIEPFAPLTAVGMSHRNFVRCLLSGGYLAGMLTILMLAVVTAFWKPASWADFFRKIGIVAALSVPLSAIGNRGLIRNSITYARFDPAERRQTCFLEFELVTTQSATAQIYWDVGAGLSEAASARRGYVPRAERQVVRFPLPDQPLRSLRFDPQSGEGAIRLAAIRVVDVDRKVLAEIPREALEPRQEIAPLRVEEGLLVIETTPGATDPILELNAAAIGAINDTIEDARDSENEI